MAFNHSHMPNKLRLTIRWLALGLVGVSSFDNALFHLFSLLLLIAVGASMRWTGSSPLKAALIETKWIHGALAAIWATMFISNMVNGQSDEAWRTMLQFGLRYWLLFSIFSYLLFTNILTVRLIFVAAITGLAFQFIPFIPAMLDMSIFNSRFQGMNRNPNTAGFQAAGLTMLSLYLAFYQKLARNIRLSLGITLGTLGLIALIASGNRGGWVAFFLTSNIFLLFMLPRHPKSVASILAGAAGFVILILTKFPQPMDRFARLLDGDSSHRLDVWENALTLWLEKPIFGHGLDLRSAMLENHFIYHEHNVFISVFAALGIFGVIAYCAMLSGILRLGLHYKNYSALLLIAMVLSVGMFAYDFYRSQIFLVHFFILAAVATHYRVREAD